MFDLPSDDCFLSTPPLPQRAINSGGTKPPTSVFSRGGGQYIALTMMMHDVITLQQHDTWAKMTNFELGVHIPLIIRVPWMQHSVGRESAVLAEMVDVFPTLASETESARRSTILLFRHSRAALVEPMCIFSALLRKSVAEVQIWWWWWGGGGAAWVLRLTYL